MLFEKAAYDAAVKGIPALKLITTATVSDKFKVCAVLLCSPLLLLTLHIMRHTTRLSFALVSVLVRCCHCLTVCLTDHWLSRSCYHQGARREEPHQAGRSAFALHRVHQGLNVPRPVVKYRPFFTNYLFFSLLLFSLSVYLLSSCGLLNATHGHGCALLLACCYSACQIAHTKNAWKSVSFIATWRARHTTLPPDRHHA